MSTNKALTALAASSLLSLLTLSTAYAQSPAADEKQQLGNSARPDVDPGASRERTSQSKPGEIPAQQLDKRRRPDWGVERRIKWFEWCNARSNFAPNGKERSPIAAISHKRSIG